MELTILLVQFLKLLLGGDGYDELGGQCEVGGRHDERMRADTGRGIHCFLRDGHHTGRNGPDLSELAARIGRDGDSDLFASLRLRFVDGERTTQIRLTNHFRDIDLRREDDFLVLIQLSKVIIDGTRSIVDAVEFLFLRTGRHFRLQLGDRRAESMEHGGIDVFDIVVIVRLTVTTP